MVSGSEILIPDLSFSWKPQMVGQFTVDLQSGVFWAQIFYNHFLGKLLSAQFPVTVFSVQGQKKYFGVRE